MVRHGSLADLAGLVGGHKPVLFLGAGVSIAEPAALPLAGQLIKGFIEALTADSKLKKLTSELPDDAFDGLLSPEIIYNAVSEYAAPVVPHLFKAALGSDRPNVNHRIVAGLVSGGYVERIITTNFDSLIEQCLDATGGRVDVRDECNEAPLWKIHGDIRAQMSIALSEVALLGFSPMPMLLARALAGKVVVVAGYSGNDLHVVRAIGESGPREVWWIVRPGDEPWAALLLGKFISVTLVEGNLAQPDDSNPFVAIWRALGKEPVKSAVISDRPAGPHSYFGAILDDIHWGQRALVLHSLVRRAGVKTSAAYRQHLSHDIHELMWNQRANPPLGYAPGDDWLGVYERKFTPQLYCRVFVLRRQQLQAEAIDDEEDKVIRLPVGLEEADVLLDIGLEHALRGDLSNARSILEAALRQAGLDKLTVTRMRASEALSWVCYAGGDAEGAREHGSANETQVRQVSDDLQTLRESRCSTVDAVLKGLDPPNEPTVYRTLLIDRRFRQAVQTLRAATRLRHHGYPDLGLQILDSNSLPLVSSVWLEALRAFHLLERGRCQFEMFKVDEALNTFFEGESALEAIDKIDLEPGRQFNRLVMPYYVRAGEIARALGANLSSTRIA